MQLDFLRCRGLEAVKRCSRVFLEAYTSVLMVPKERLVRDTSICLASQPANQATWRSNLHGCVLSHMPVEHHLHNWPDWMIFVECKVQRSTCCKHGINAQSVNAGPRSQTLILR